MPKAIARYSTYSACARSNGCLWAICFSAGAPDGAESCCCGPCWRIWRGVAPAGGNCASSGGFQQLESMVPYFLNPDAMRVSVQQHTAHLKHPVCSALTSIQVMPNGDVLACFGMPPVGNIKTTPIRQIWRDRPRWWKGGALLDQVEERQPLVAVVLGDRHHQAQVGLDHLLLGVEVAALDALREVDLLLGCQQSHLADVLQEQLQRVGSHVGLQVERDLGLAAPALVRGSLHLVGDGRCRVDVLDQLDLRALEEPVQLLDVGLVDVEPGRGRRDLRD